MNRDLYSAVRHADVDLMSPLPLAVYRVLLREAMDRGSGLALDIGCGKAAILMLLAERGWTVRGVDRSNLMIQAARDAAAERGVGDRVHLIGNDAAAEIDGTTNGSVDLAVCVGSTQVFGGLMPAAKALRRIVRSGGTILLGDLYWRRDPSTDLLAILGMQRTDLEHLCTMFDRPTEVGFEPLACVAATEAEFHEYEAVQYEAGKRWCALNPDHPDSAAILDRTEAWWSLYQAHTRACFGFAACSYRAC